MAVVHYYGLDVQFDNSQPIDSQWSAVVMYKPGTVCATPTAPSVTTGPLGSSGQATATHVSGAGTQVGWPSVAAAIQAAVQLAANDKATGN